MRVFGGWASALGRAAGPIPIPTRIPIHVSPSVPMTNKNRITNTSWGLAIRAALNYLSRRSLVRRRKASGAQRPNARCR